VGYFKSLMQARREGLGVVSPYERWGRKTNLGVL
jgi:hypothetical protein